MAAYYNEFDPYAAQWLRALIAAGHIAPGDVDTRSIEDVTPQDLKGYTQCHFFAGLGGWSYALRLAGWPDDHPVWTGSCPCQPFSAAGKGEGFADERHLWPAWFHLIEQRQPGIVFGEQVEAAIRHGWLDLVQTDLEGIGYAVGAVGIPAAGIGAPHIRQRLWFVADRAGERRGEARTGRGRPTQRIGNGSEFGGLADAKHAKRRPQRFNRQDERDGGRTEAHGIAGACGEICNGVALGNAERTRLAQQRSERRTSRKTPGADAREAAERAGASAFWSACDWLPCRDGKARPVEPGTFPLAHGVSARVGRLRAYGNAIVPQVAEEFVRAYLECQP